jgi:hypothetical protein
MNPDNQAAAEPSRIGGSPVRPDRPDAAEAAREATLDRLHSLVLERDEAPRSATACARSSSGLRSIDDDPAALVYDSTTDDELLASVRSGGPTSRLLTFQADELALEMEVSGSRQLVGQVVPPQASVVELRHSGGTIAMNTDDLGCFHLSAMPKGPVSFRCRPAGSATHSVATSWIML